MKIGILGSGSIGKTLALKLAAAGHDVKVANSRGPETIGADVLASGAHAVSSAESRVRVTSPAVCSRLRSGVRVPVSMPRTCPRSPTLRGASS